MNLDTLFKIPLQRTPHKAALQFTKVGESPVEYSYAQLHSTAADLAMRLQAWGLNKGDRVAFYLGSRPEFVVAFLAVTRLGGVVVPINTHYRRGEIGHILADSTPRLLITEGAQCSVLAEVNVDACGVEELLCVEDLTRWQPPGLPDSQPWVGGDDLALIIYTSGTTGQSKGAMISHNNVLATVTGLLSAWAWQSTDVLLLTLPLFHVHGLLVGLLCALAAGATVRLYPRFELESVLTELYSGVPTLYFAVPTIYVRLVDALCRRARPDPLTGMRLFCSGSAPLSAETFAAFQELTGHTILERYGMTETGMNFSNPYAGPRVPGSVGLPLPGVSARIVDDQGHDVLMGREGDLLVRGSNVFAGYWQAPEKSAASFCVDGTGVRWFRTGDLACQDPSNGYVTLLGRRHELIISGGYNIYPREIEELLVSVPGVREAAVVGVNHPEWGEVPVAYLVVDQPLDEAALAAHCREQLADFKLPREFRMVEQLPRNAMGKIQKHLLPR